MLDCCLPCCIRDFLLFLPQDSPGLKAVMSYYSSTVKLNAEGDTLFHEIEGLGTIPRFLSVCFGSIVRIAFPPKFRSFPNDPNQYLDLSGSGTQQTSIASSVHEVFEVFPATDSITAPVEIQDDYYTAETSTMPDRKLTAYLPDPGYFAAGAIAGVVSRTATAPLDRLKVYLIANTEVAAKNSMQAMKKGDALAATKHVGRPLIEACKELWRAGGMRSLFAGISSLLMPEP